MFKKEEKKVEFRIISKWNEFSKQKKEINDGKVFNIKKKKKSLIDGEDGKNSKAENCLIRIERRNQMFSSNAVHPCGGTMDMREGALGVLAAGAGAVELWARDHVTLPAVRAVGAEPLQETLAHSSLVVYLYKINRI